MLCGNMTPLVRPVLEDQELARVLVCDDYLAMRRLLVELLTHLGLEVSCARDGKEALALARKLHPALIISDIVMPELNGIELVEAIRQDSELAGISCILMSSPNWAEAASNSGCDCFIVKPFGAAQVQNAVRKLLDIHEELQ